MTEESEPSSATFTPTRNYTGEDEKSQWWYLKRWSKDWKSCITMIGMTDPYGSQRENFRTRRSYWWPKTDPRKALRIRIGNSNEIGAMVKLTNSYFLVGGEDESSENFCRTVEGDLPEMPVIRTSLSGCRVIGRMCVGNKHGLIVPETTYDTEIQQLRLKLPDSVKIQKVEERLSALGNVIACNDHIALVHPELDKETEEIIVNTLQVEVFRDVIVNNPLVGSYCVLNNFGGLIHADTKSDSLESMSSILQLPLFTGTVNGGTKIVASGLVVNDSIVYAGMKTTSDEFRTIEKAFHCDRGGCCC